MRFFTQEFLSFFAELGANNDKTWFDANRVRYSQHVKRPFESFIEEIISRVQKEDPEVDITAKDAILRINRDIRFSRDKTPYNTYVAAVISRYGKKDKTYPGLFLRLSASDFGIYGGVYMADTQQLQHIRQAIAENLTEFHALISAPAFKKKFGEIHGEKHKRVPPEFKEALEQEPLIANKQYYYMAQLQPGTIISDKLADAVMEHYMAAKDVMAFLQKALNPKGNKA